MSKEYPDVSGGDNSSKSAGVALKAFFERIERLSEEKTDIGVDIREVFAEAKGQGWDVKVMRTMLKKRKQDRAERLEQEALEDIYASALRLVGDDEDDESGSNSD